jgi:preprotein translocase subunit SecY
MILYAGLIIGFAFFYTALVFNSQENGRQPQEVGRTDPGYPALARLPPTMSMGC